MGVSASSLAGRSWTALLQARADDPGAPAVARLAMALLDADPPLAGRLAAWAALAAQAYASGDDQSAMQWAAKGLAQIDGSADAEPYRADLAYTRLSALCRGGDPAVALQALHDAEQRGAVSDDARLGLRAVAVDRSAQPAVAAVAYARWRASMADTDPAAPWAEHRARVLAGQAPLTALAAALEGVAESAARTCIAARMGELRPEGDAPAWVQRCASEVERIGVLLPRTGPLSALADEQLMAATAAAQVLGARYGAAEILWEDPGSTVAGTRKAIAALRAAGADVLVGPIGPSLVAAAAAEVGEALPLVTPGEGQGVARGVAPSLEARVQALVALARKRGKTRLVVLAPDNAYGQRSVEAARKAAQGMGHDPVVRTYKSGETSFSPTLKPITTALSESAALLIPDHLSRAEMLVRQLARLGKAPAQADAPGLMVLTTAEGASQAGLDKAGQVFEGVWAAPAATPAVAGGTGRKFARQYAKLADTLPGDHAMLVYYAMHMAFTGRAAKGSGRPSVVRVVEGAFVAGHAATGPG